MEREQQQNLTGIEMSLFFGRLLLLCPQATALN